MDQVFSEEFETKINSSLEDLLYRVVQGGYPEVLLNKADPTGLHWFRSYVDTVVHREIRDIAHIEGLIEIPRLLALLATRIGGLLNYADIGRDVGLPQTTLKRLIRAPKIYLNDTGLATYLLGINKPQLQNNREKLGFLLENFLVGELIKQQSYSELRPRIYHYRTHGGEEVDFILENWNGEIVGIEVKSSSTLSLNDFKGLQDLSELLGKQSTRGILFYTGNKIIPVGKNLLALPLQSLWQT